MSRSLLNRLGLDRPELRAWAMYDWANSAFATTIMAAMLPIYFANVAAVDLPPNVRTAYWGYTSGLALALMAVFAPAMGAIADVTGGQKKFLAFFTVLGSVASMGLWFVHRGDWVLASALYLVGNIGFAGSLVFYDALLPNVAKPEEIDRVSTAGYAIGYVGGGVLLALNLAWTLKPEFFGFPDKGVAARASFVSVGVWWLVFAIPLWRRVPGNAGTRAAHEVGHPIRIGVLRLVQTARDIRRYKQVMIYLVGFWFYTDGIGTIIKMATMFGAEIGIGETHLIGALLLVQFLGIPATFAFGMMAERLGAKASLMVSLGVYAGICVLGFFMTKAWHFWVLAGMVALVQGGSQALSRSLYAVIVPRSKAAEFFSFNSVFSKFAGILGPVLFGWVAISTGSSRSSILFLISFFVVGMGCLVLLDVDEGRRVAEAAEAELIAQRAR